MATRLHTACRTSSTAFESARALPVLALLLAVAVGCSRDAPYTIQTPPTTLTAGNAGQVEVQFVPGPGFKFNEEFPARLKVVETGTVQVARQAFTRADGDFSSREGIGTVRIDLTPGSTGSTAIKATADFSMCNDDECRIFRFVPVEIPIQVQ